jgi:hypothetical protein
LPFTESGGSWVSALTARKFGINPRIRFGCLLTIAGGPLVETVAG